jgi:hypothetical protein
MRRLFLLIFWQFGLLAGGRLFADVVTLKDGRQISGSVESGNIQELHIKVGDQSQTIDIHDVKAIQFGVTLPAAPPPKAAELAGTIAGGIGAETASRTTDSTDRKKASLDGVEVPPADANAPGIEVKSQAQLILTGKGLKNALVPPFTNSLTPPAFIDSKRSGQ